MWNFKDNTKVEKKFIDYHMMSINEPEFTNTQVYEHRIRALQSNEDYTLVDLDYSFNLDSTFEKTLLSRKSARESFENNKYIDKKCIAQFCQLAFIGGNKENRTYPSGGAQFYINIHFLFNENLVDTELVEVGNVMNLNCDTQKLLVKSKQGWDYICNAFIQGYLANTAQFAIVLSCNVKEISKKYTDISYKLIQQEAGHIGQNIQLVSEYLKIESVPLGGFYDIELSNILGNNQTALYAFLLG